MPKSNNKRKNGRTKGSQRRKKLGAALAKKKVDLSWLGETPNPSSF